MSSSNKPDALGDLLGWLGRQVGHITKAVKSDVTQPPVPHPPPPAETEPRVVYRDRRTEEQLHPDRPDVVLRRTIVDEMIVQSAPPTEGGAGGSTEVLND